MAGGGKRGKGKSKGGRGRGKGRGGEGGGGEGEAAAAAAAAGGGGGGVPEAEVGEGAAAKGGGGLASTQDAEEQRKGLQVEVAALQTKKGRLEKAVRQLEAHLHGRGMAPAGAGAEAGEASLVATYVAPIVHDILQPLRGGAVTPSSVAAAAALAVGIAMVLRSGVQRS